MMSKRVITSSDGVFDGAGHGVSGAGNMRIRRHSSLSGAMFECPDGTHLRFRNMVIDGGTTFNTTYDATSGYASEGPTGCMIEAFGQITIENCTLQRGNGRCIYAHNDGTTKRDFVLTDVLIRGFKDTHGSAIFFRNLDWHNATLTRVEISGCWSTENSYGGTIRENGGTKTNMTVIDCNIHNNKSKCGAGIYWNAGGVAAAKCIIKGNTIIHDNIATLNGGGVYCEARMDIQGNVQIYNNTAEYGGGIYFRSYYGGIAEYDGQGFNVKVTDNVQIYNNTATRYGGGMCLRILNTPDIGFNASGNAFSPTFSLTVESGSIHQNHAPKGGGVAILDLAAKKCRGHESDGTGLSGEIVRWMKITGGTVHDNYTQSSSLISEQAGAGFYIRKYEAPFVDDATDGEANPIANGGYSALGGAGTITVTAEGGLIYNNTTNSGNGGGMHIVNEFYGTNISNDCHVEVKNVAEIYNNTCYGNGAGVYVNGGNFVMNGGTIGKSGYPNIANQGNGGGIAVDGGNITINSGNINYNQAKYVSGTQGHGGAFYLTGGIATVNGGNVSHNAADKNGGGFYVNVNNNTDITTIKGGALVTENTAVLGAGAYINKGTLLIQDASTTIGNNTASTSGGGLYMNNGTVTMTNAKVNNNTATSTHGGGLYVNSGAVTATNVTFSGNTASKRGGGMYVSGGGNNTISGGSIYSNTAGTDGGGCFVSGKLTIQEGAQLYSNTATNNGGGAYVTGGDFSLLNCTVGGSAEHANQATTQYGGGIYVDGNATVLVTGGEVSYNKALATNNGRGGGLYLNASSTQPITFNGGVHINYNEAYDGGGAYVAQGNLLLDGIGVEVSHNTATRRGGGFYTSTGANAGTVTLNGILMSENTAQTGDGGGLYVGKGSIYVNGTEVLNNHADSGKGGGIYANETGCFVEVQKYTYSGKAEKQSELAGNTAVHGGALYVNDGQITIKDSSAIDANTATGNGGGIYIGGGGISMTGGVIGGDDASAANTATLGGGIYSADGAITVSGGNIAYNEAERGGGIYSFGGEVHFSNGNIQYNQASEQGGGIYVGETGELFMNGSAQLVRNHVPTGKDGGGVYLLGVITVGEQVDNPADLGVITAKDNFAYTTSTPASYTITDQTRNNVYLPVPEVRDDHRDVITVIENGISTASEIGFSVPSNYVPVIYCANSGVMSTETGYEDYTTSQYFLHQFSTGMEFDDNLFDDTHHYIAVHYVGQEPIFDPDHVYLYGFWTNIVTGDPEDPEFPIEPEDFDPMAISTPAQLAYFISYVNGLNGETEHHDANGKLLADIDMSQFGWVPIGHLSLGYTGTFDGNGHTVTGISSLLFGDYMNYGFFGRLNGGTVKDLFVKDAVYALEYKDGLIIGGLAGEIAGNTVVENSEVSCSITALHPNTIMGGVIGRQSAGTVHSVIGIADMTGYLMGGLVGENSGKLYNSFSNVKFTPHEGSTAYMGGLVGKNYESGEVENCYSRIRPTVPTSRFGSLVGDNEGSVKYCYAPANMYTFKAHGIDPLAGYGNYGSTLLPYLYCHRDTQISLAESTTPYVPTGDDVDKQMLIALNNWVNTINANQTDIVYTNWNRPTTMVINNDFPVLLMPDHDAVATAMNDPYLYYGQVDNLMESFTESNEAIYLYRTTDDGTVASNAGSEAELYIDENVALIQDGALTAHVGITLDNSAGANGAQPTFGGIVPGTDPTDCTDWHMFATPLANVPLGINYTDNEQWGDGFEYGHPAGMPYYLFYPEDSENHGYFPSHRFAKPYPSSNTSVEAGNYYPEWDFYCYYEPEYHWINFKRNGNSHWHENQHDAQIEYKPYGTIIENEANLIPGKGYLVATREDGTFLQAKGTLNGDSVVFPVTREGFYSTGYNLLGNPFQAYLDFDRFAQRNMALWNGETPCYYIIDEDQQGYVGYAYGGSDNPSGAGQFLHPHQGFMLYLVSGEGGNAYFTGHNAARPSSVEMRSVVPGDAFRDARPAYPLVNLFATEDNGNRSMATVELGRPDHGGACVMHDIRISKGLVYCHNEGNDYSIAFTQPGITEAAIRFETLENSEYTMTWNTHNGDFTYLHLIDNLTGADIDCLAESEYRFMSRTTDYKSRFRLVFGYTGIEEPENEGTTMESFAFLSNGQLIVNGEGTLQLFDVTGRLLCSQELHGTQNEVNVTGVSSGVYLLRLNTANGMKVQKIVIK